MDLVPRFVLPVHLYGGVADCEGFSRWPPGAARSREGAARKPPREPLRPRDGRPRPGGGLLLLPDQNLGAYGGSGAVATRDASTSSACASCAEYGWTRRDFASARAGIPGSTRSGRHPAREARDARGGEPPPPRDRRALRRRVRRIAAAAPAHARARCRPGTSTQCASRPAAAETFQAHLASRGVGTGSTTRASPQPAYAFLGHRRGDFPVSRRRATRSCRCRSTHALGRAGFRGGRGGLQLLRRTRSGRREPPAPDPA